MVDLHLEPRASDSVKMGISPVMPSFAQWSSTSHTNCPLTPISTAMQNDNLRRHPDTHCLVAVSPSSPSSPPVLLCWERRCVLSQWPSHPRPQAKDVWRQPVGVLETRPARLHRLIRHNAARASSRQGSVLLRPERLGVHRRNASSRTGSDSTSKDQPTSLNTSSVRRDRWAVLLNERISATTADNFNTFTMAASLWHRHPHALLEGTRSLPTCVPSVTRMCAGAERTPAATSVSALLGEGGGNCRAAQVSSVVSRRLYPLDPLDLAAACVTTCITRLLRFCALRKQTGPTRIHGVTPRRGGW